MPKVNKPYGLLHGLQAWWAAKAPSPHEPRSLMHDPQVFPSTASLGRGERRLAVAAVVLSAALFIALVPFARIPLAPVWAFIPIYESALAINDLITAVLLFAQFWILRSRSLLLLACGYLFTAAMVVVHALTFPGLFSATGLFGAGPQSTAWLYMFWHAGFPIVVIAYVFTQEDAKREAVPPESLGQQLLLGILSVLAVVVALTLLATAAQAVLPAIMHGNSYSTSMIVVVSTTWMVSILALLALWTRTNHTILNTWLMVVMCAWVFDIGLSAVFNAGRFDLGFYAGRIYGLSAATFVLSVLLADAVRLYGRLVQLLDIEQTERRRESELRRRVFETSLDLILVCDRQCALTQVSPSCHAILGYRPEEMIGRNAADFVCGADLEITRAEMRTARRGGLTRNFECRYMHRDGRAIPLVWTGVWSQTDQLHFFTGRDLSERVKLEAQLRQAQKMEAIGQLTGGVAHDFNNILAVIMGTAELAAARTANNSQLESMLKQIEEAAERGALLVQRMLAFARKQPLQPRSMEINDAIKHTAAMLERTLGEHITLKTSLAAELWPAFADPAQFQDALVNLCVNARDAMPKGGHIVIETANLHLDADSAEIQAGEYVMVVVTDTGTGMTRETLEHAFEPFYTTKEVGRGTGLGLSMVYGFVKQSGGHVRIESEVGRGTTVKLYLPRYAMSRSKVSSQMQDEMPMAEGETVLVVEDNPDLRKLSVRRLTMLGYQVYETGTGPAALALLDSRQHIDLIFSDIIMPGGMTGYELADRARERFPSIKVLLTSGYDAESASAEESTASNLKVLRKPYKQVELARAIRETLGR
jgi:PAS domain S-box-containing protein